MCRKLSSTSIGFHKAHIIIIIFPDWKIGLNAEKTSTYFRTTWCPFPLTKLPKKGYFAEQGFNASEKVGCPQKMGFSKLSVFYAILKLWMVVSPEKENKSKKLNSVLWIIQIFHLLNHMRRTARKGFPKRQFLFPASRRGKWKNLKPSNIFLAGVSIVLAQNLEMKSPPTMETNTQKFPTNQRSNQPTNRKVNSITCYLNNLRKVFLFFKEGLRSKVGTQ